MHWNHVVVEVNEEEENQQISSSIESRSQRPDQKKPKIKKKLKLSSVEQ